jgi:hypothetical protein
MQCRWIGPNSPRGASAMFRRFFGPHQAGGVTRGNACSCCCACNRLFLNGRWIQRQTDKPNAK